MAEDRRLQITELEYVECAASLRLRDPLSSADQTQEYNDSESSDHARTLY